MGSSPTFKAHLIPYPHQTAPFSMSLDRTTLVAPLPLSGTPATFSSLPYISRDSINMFKKASLL
jgi:hypothetical protein